MRLTIGFVTAGLPFNGDTIKTSSLGGSETALVCLARELKKLGHDVKVFCECPQPGVYDDVSYFHHRDFTQMVAVMHFDVLVVSRFLNFLTQPTPAGLRLLWLHDMPTEKNQLMPSLWQTDKLIMLSKFHKESYVSAMEELENHVWLSTNGVDMDTVNDNRQAKVTGKVIYTSRPERGLPFLLEKVLPRLLEKRPKLELHYANYDLGNLQIPQHIAQTIQYAEHLAKQYPKNVFSLGHLSKENLYRELSEAELLLYPTAFPEISCISAMEAQACGTPIITTNDFALKETIVHGETGILIDGKPTEDAYIDSFVEETLSLLSDRGRMDRMGKAGVDRVVDKYRWSVVAKLWSKMMIKELEEQYASNPIGVVHELERRHDLVTAELVATSAGFPCEATRIHEAAHMVASTTRTDTNRLTDVPTKLKEALPQFDRLIQILQSESCKPSTVLDFHGKDASFGLYFKRKAPDSSVIVTNPDSNTLFRVDKFAMKCKLDLERYQLGTPEVLLEKLSPSEKFELVFVGDLLTKTMDPVSFVKRFIPLMAKDGYFAFTAPRGTPDLRYSQETKHDRIWNFSLADLWEFFGEAKDFNASFVEGQIIGDSFLGNWVVIFKLSEDSVFGRIDYDRKKISTKPYQTLALCAIVQDEEDNVGKALKSAIPVCDNVVVIDTGSTDNTVARIKELGIEAEVIPFDNFGLSRNQSKENVEEDWIFWMDADEVLVNASLLRKYLHSRIYEGFVVRQQHLMLDVHGTFDVPVRVFRNRSHFQFTGLIHEHAEDISKGPFDNPIHPALVLSDVDLAHYGYLNESVRREKCSNRNMQLLRREITECPGRKLTWILVMRDYLNIVKWELDRTQGRIIAGTEHADMLQATISTYYEHFLSAESKYHVLAFPMYQQALEILGQNGLCVEDRRTPPVQVAFVLSGRIGGLENTDLKPNCIWFVDDDELQAFLTRKGGELATAIELCLPAKYETEAVQPAYKPYGDPDRLLAVGTDKWPNDHERRPKT